MKKEQGPGSQGGFTLVELLIVVIILAILAAIVIPQFTDTTDDARATAIASNLASMRSAIEVYRQQHGSYPAATAASGGTCATGAAGTGALNTEQAFREQLTLYTNPAGQSCTGTGGAFTFGPYIRELPINPANNLATVEILNGGVLGGLPAPDDSHGWIFDVITGELAADSP
jgi:prepilin-type N-terminal cleavage/methylation domain-containing protein